MHALRSYWLLIRWQTLRLQAFLLQHSPLFIEKQQPNGPLQHQKTLEAAATWFPEVAMGAHIGAWLQHVEKSLHQIAAVVEIVVFAQAF